MAKIYEYPITFIFFTPDNPCDITQLAPGAQYNAR